MNFTTIKDQACRIMWSQRDPSLRRSGVGNVFMKNLDETVDNKAFYDTFSLFGNILSCKVATDENGKSKGYGYVHYETGVSANMAIAKVDGMLIAGKQVHVGHFVRRDNRAGQADWTNLYVKGLPASWDDAKLREEFEKHGPITSCKVQVHEGEDAKEKGNEGKSRGFGFVNFEEHDSAVNAIEAFNGTEVPDGEGTTTLYCARAQKKSERQRELQSKYEQVKMERMKKFQGVNVYVKNLDEGVTDDTMREAFSPYGTITSARVMVDNTSGQSKGFGFVCFSAPEEATKAITEMNGKMLLNKPIYIALAQRRDVRRTQLEAQFAQRTGMPPRGLPMPGQGMYSMPYWMGAQPGMPQQPRQYMVPHMMPRGARGPMPAYGRGNYPMPTYAPPGQASSRPMPGQPQQRRPAGPRQQRGQLPPPGWAWCASRQGYAPAASGSRWSWPRKLQVHSSGPQPAAARRSKHAASAVAAAPTAGSLRPPAADAGPRPSDNFLDGSKCGAGHERIVDGRSPRRGAPGQTEEHDRGAYLPSYL
ncbi:unnamed protein product [Ascophyllum nodosum]